MAIFGGGIDLLGNPSQEGLYKMLVFMAAGFLSILVHELGHGLMMKRYGRQPDIILHGLGGVAISQGRALSRMESFLVTIMGPLAQIALGCIAFGIFVAVGPSAFPTVQSLHFVESLYFVSFFWALINLIPIFPLDGGQILSIALGPKRQRAVHVTSIVIAGLMVGYLLANGIVAIFGLVILAMLIMDNVKALKGVR